MLKQQSRHDKSTEQILVAAAKRGDNGAFDKLLRCHEQRVLAVAQRITKNREDAEDVMQESFQKAFLRLHEFEGRSRFSTWLTRIAINESFMSIRRRRMGLEKKTIRPENGWNAIAETVADRAPDPEVQCWRHERAEMLRKAIARLNNTARTTILLRAFEEHTIHETARIMRTNITTVKARTFRGQRKLRSLLKPALLAELQPFQIEAAEHS